MLITIPTTIQHDTSHSPVALYQLDGNLHDTSGNSRPDLSLVSGTTRYCDLHPGMRGVYFDNVTQFRVQHVSLQITGALTVQFFASLGLKIVNGATLSSATMCFLSHAGNKSTSAEYELYSMKSYSSNCNPQYQAQSSIHGTLIFRNTTESFGMAGVHQHTLVRSASGTVTYYINGIAQAGSASPLDAPTDGGNGYLYLGGSSLGDEMLCASAVSSVKICNVEFSPTDVLNSYNSTLGQLFPRST